ncbi:Hypothetical protein PHPALM_18667 [Phytophthora palmivora]|uniref:Uncharacterized protein n=1 Tax=Phytophthora palmivora TaxID=4796 RepID=A0A2P4XJ62_9STRA|nr:Hypothetical protein PHPALM_18667 [Phytophthora palmivora]
MADASDIYRRFVEAPLRLKTRTPSPSPPSTPPASTQQYDASNPSPWGDSPAFSTRSKEVKKLRQRVAKISLSAIDSVVPRGLYDELQAAADDDLKRSAGTGSVDAKSTQDQAETENTDTNKTLLKKKKRVTRSVTMIDEDTGAEFMDTPTKASNPPKRFRKYSGDSCCKKESKGKSGKENCNVFSFSLQDALDDGKESEVVSRDKAKTSAPRRRTSVTVTLPLRRSRRLQHIKAESPKVVAPMQTVHHTKEVSDAIKPVAKAPMEDVKDVEEAVGTTISDDAVPQVPVDLISTYSDALLSTNTISGCFFALAWNAIRDVEQLLLSKCTSSESNPLKNVFTICIGIAECEKLAQCSFPVKSPTLKSPKSTKPSKSELPRPRRRSSGKIMMKVKKAKKHVRFRTFDLSCLNLQYVEDEQVAITVDKILAHYGGIMEKLETMLSRSDAGTDTPELLVLRNLSRVMAIPSEMYSTPQSNADASDASSRIYRRAFGGRDSYSQREIRICGDYFARQFTNLLLPQPSPPSPPQFLQRVFSSLASSSVRFKLRVLFIESEDFGEDVSGSDVLQSRVLLDENGKAFPAMAPYEHQDLGAAIHWALQESVLYWSLVKPLLNMLMSNEGNGGDLGEDARVKTYLDESAAEDLDHMEKYVLARRFLRFHLTKSWRHRVKDGSDAADTWKSIEKVCTLAKRFHFEDEVHLFPLASINEFVDLLAREEPTLQRMEEVLQSFYEQKYGERVVLHKFVAARILHGMPPSYHQSGESDLDQMYLMCTSVPLRMPASP